MDTSVQWQDRARCRDLDPELFFPPLEAESTDQRQVRERTAKAVCAACQVRSECLSWALANHERLGVWGGTTERERRVLSTPGRQRQRVAAV